MRPKQITVGIRARHAFYLMRGRREKRGAPAGRVNFLKSVSYVPDDAHQELGQAARTSADEF